MAYKILIVEDEEELRELIFLQLEEADREFLFAANGEEAIRILEKNKIDFLITDLAMPKVNGFELLRSIKKHNWVFPTLVLTGHADSLVANQLRPYGVGHFLNKPWRKDELMEIVTSTLAKKDKLTG